jgi:hypothetical protein
MALASIVVLAARTTTAQTTDELRTYRFIPSRSTLQVTGGPAGVQQFFTYGTFGLIIGQEATPSDEGPPVLVSHAEFVDVASLLVRDTQSPSQWTDQRLNLSGLDGSFSANAPNELVFHGVDGQNKPLTITGVQRGRLLHLVGENSPGCCGFLKYNFDALAYVSPYADFNLDGVVDVADADVLSSNMGTYSIATFEQGDADGDGDVDGNDFLTWQREIGLATAMSEFTEVSSAGFAAASAAVPEAGTIALAMISILHFVFCRQRKKDVATRGS